MRRISFASGGPQGSDGKYVFSAFRRAMIEVGCAYFESPEWKALRGRCREREHGACKACGEPGNTAHHASYRNFAWADDDELKDLEWLCEPCHLKRHLDNPLTTPFFVQKNASWAKEVPSSFEALELAIQDFPVLGLSEKMEKK